MENPGKNATSAQKALYLEYKLGELNSYPADYMLNLLCSFLGEHDLHEVALLYVREQIQDSMNPLGHFSPNQEP